MSPPPKSVSAIYFLLLLFLPREGDGENRLANFFPPIPILLWRTKNMKAGCREKQGERLMRCPFPFSSSFIFDDRKPFAAFNYYGRCRCMNVNLQPLRIQFWPSKAAGGMAKIGHFRPSVCNVLLSARGFFRAPLNETLPLSLLCGSNIWSPIWIKVVGRSWSPLRPIFSFCPVRAFCPWKSSPVMSALRRFPPTFCAKAAF